MPSVHAILLIALGGITAADPRDQSVPAPATAIDPFLAPAEYRAPEASRARAPSGGSPITVRLAQPPLPGDYVPADPGDANAMGAGAVEPAAYNEPAAADGNYASEPATLPQWNNTAVGPPDNTAAGDADAGRWQNVPEASTPQPDGRDRSGSIPLAPPNEAGDGLRHVLPTVAWPVVAGSLGGVIGLFLIMAWLMRRGTARVGGPLPREVLEVLGRTPLADRKQMQLLRLGNKLVLISVSATGADTLAEITDPVEVDRLTGYCYQNHPNSSTVAFHKVFKSFETTPKRRATRGAGRVDFSDLEHLGVDDSPGA